MKKDTKESFQKEWSIYDYNDKTWGLNVEERKKIFLRDMDVIPEKLRNKIILDAGCGNGTLSMGLSDFGMRVVAMDIIDLRRIKKEIKANSNVHFIQGSVLEPPLKLGLFDFVFSSGVIHHTPDPKKAFRELIKLVKIGGKIYIWVYRKKKGPKDLIIYSISRITSRLPISFQNLIYSLFTMIFRTIEIFNRKKIKKNRTERMVWFYDSLSPRYQSRHSLEEIFSWFKEEKISNIKLTNDGKHGYGVCGEK